MKQKSLETMGARFRYLRDREGLTQDDVAKKLSLTKTSISSFEHDNHAMSLNKFVLLKQVFEQDFSWDWLIGDAEGAKNIMLDESDLEYAEAKRSNLEINVENYRTQVADLKKENAWLKEIIDRLTKKE